MNSLELDPRAQKVQTIAKAGGVAVVAVAAAGVVTIAGASLAVAGVVGLVGLTVVNFLVPVAARSIAIAKQKSLTAIAETFSEETIREDERQEEERVNELQNQYVTARANIENAQDELRSQLSDATPEEKELLNSQISALQEVIDDAEKTIEQRVEDLSELKRQNKLYVALHRAGKAMSNAQGSKRNAEEMQRIETARAAIKTRMRAAMAGQKMAQISSGMKPANDALNVVGGKK
jgi:hypothetical protein